MRAIVFVGPSRPDTVPSSETIDVRPPAAAGDIYRAVRRGVQLIALIDARFQDLQTVRHKEILHALEAGVHVWGAASMGALRAAECAAFGMRGFGRIFRDYRDGILQDDHEVALVHGPAELGYPALTEPLVNVRATLAVAEAHGLMTSAEVATTLGTAQAMFYRTLTWPALGKAMSDPALGRRVAGLEARRIDLKKADAAEMIAAVVEAAEASLAPNVPTFQLQRTHHWRAHETRFARAEDVVSETEASVLDELRLDPVRYRDMLLRAFARRTVADRGDAEHGSGLVDELRAELGLGTAVEFRAWLDANETTDARLGAFLAHDEAMEEAIEQAAPDLSGMLLDELRTKGLFAEFLSRAQAKTTTLHGRTCAVPGAFVDFDLSDLIGWFCRSRRLEAPTDDPDAVAKSLGLADRSALHRLLRREYEFLRAREDAA